MHEAFGDARWLQDPRFDGLAVIDTFGRHLHFPDVARRVFAQHKPGFSNVHMLLRKSFQLDARPPRAILTITADDYYKLWINGHFVGQGPAPGYPSRHFYNTWDVAALLRPGTNEIAVHVYYQGMLTRVWNSADHRMGMIARLALDTQSIVSDASWRYKGIGKPTTVTGEDHFRRRSPEHYYEPNFSGGMIGSLTQFSENIDAREIEEGWREPAFDDAAWQAPSAVDVDTKDYHLEPQPTPPLEHHRVAPAKVDRVAAAHYLIDFGHEVVGRFGMTLPGRDGHVVEIRHAEELTPEGLARVPMRCNCDYREFWTLAGKPTHTLDYFDYKGFRYVEVRGATGEIDASTCWTDARHYPWPDNCRFRSSHDLLDRIWDLCVQSVKWCAQEGSVDCPNREKGQYLGDLPYFGQAHVLLTRDTRLFRKALVQFADTARITPGLLSIAPGNFMQEIADFSLIFPEQVEFDYWQTGDRATLARLLPIAEGVIEFFRRFENDRGLLSDVSESWNLVDWPEGMRDNYDFQLPGGGNPPGPGPHAVLNMLYFGARQCVSRLRQLLGRDRLDSERLHRAIIDSFFDDSQGCFVDAPGSKHASLHSNVMASYNRVIDPDSDAARGVWKLIESKRMACGPHLAYFLLHALFRSGRHDFAFDLITCRDTNSWATMLDCGATSALEAWSPDLKSNCTWCHSWAVSPAAMLVVHVMGLQPETPGWGTVRFDPRTPSALREATLEVSLPQGPAHVSHRWDGASIIYDVSVPDGVEIRPAPNLRIESRSPHYCLRA